MTPEKLEAWEKLFRTEAEKGAWLLDNRPELFNDFYAKVQTQNIAAYRELADFHATLAAKMREPNRWHATYDADLEYGYTDVVLGEPDPRADSCRPIIYLDSLGVNDD